MRRIAFDIETAPNISAVWGMWEQNISWDMFIEFSYLLCWSALDIDTGEMWHDSIHLHHKKPDNDDKEIVKSLWKLVDSADVLIAHNGDKFDVPVMNTRFLKHGLYAPAPYQTVDTLKIARKHFKFPSNRLDHLGDYLGLGRKEKVTYKDTWAGCLRGEVDAFERMLKYNIRDTELLTQVYIKLRSYAKTNHSVALLRGNSGVCKGTDTVCDGMVCVECGSHEVIRMGVYHNKTQSYRRYKCKSCGRHQRGANIKAKSDKVTTLVAI